ncbi:MAG TPA: hypothetical protein PL106_08395, partial [Flavobacteriales bacterium]|nr:hypothetical protein [Flavobacteriales bacterium]
MPRNRRTTVLLAILAVVSVVALVQYWPTTPPPVAVTGAPARPAGRPSTATSITAPDVHLQALSAERPRPQDEPER